MNRLCELLGVESFDAAFIENLLEDCDRTDTYYPNTSDLEKFGITKIDANSLIALIMDKILYRFMDKISKYIKAEYPTGDYAELDDSKKYFNYIVNGDWHPYNVIDYTDSHYVIDIKGKEFWIDSALELYIHYGIERAFEKLKNILNY